MNRTLRFLPVILLVAVVPSVAACGGDDGSGSATAADREEKAEKARLDFARCMRRNGVNLPDPQSGPGGEGIRVRIPPGISPQRVEAAQRKCQRYLRAAFGGRSPRSDPRFRDAALKFARCMRSNGVDVPDPATQPREGGGLLRIGPGKLNPDSPRVRAAMDKCRRWLPSDDRPGEKPAD
jgi:hypothetical protein